MDPHRQLAPPLAINGGPAVRTAPFAPWPVFDEETIDAVVRVLRSGKVNYWTGNEVRLFEQEFAGFVETNYAVAVANGTVALELALEVLGIGAGDEVIVPSRTFIASASSVVMRGAKPVIADIDTHSQNLTAETIRPALSRRTKAVIAVHLAGWPCDMDPIMELAQEHDLKVIEDCAQAHGAKYKGRPIGSLGHVAAFSFCQDKILTTGGEGGMLTTSDEEVYKLAWSFKDHGKSWDAVHKQDHPPGFRWLHEQFGTNWRLTEMQSAIGRRLLLRLDGWVEKRRANALKLQERLAKIDAIRITSATNEIYHSYYKYYAFLRPEKLARGWDRDRIVEAINAEGVPCYGGSCSEIYLEQAFDSAGLKPAGRLPVAKQLGETSLMFLVHPTLTSAEIEDTARAITKVFAVAAPTQRVRTVRAA